MDVIKPSKEGSSRSRRWTSWALGLVVATCVLVAMQVSLLRWDLFPVQHKLRRRMPMPHLLDGVGRMRNVSKPFSIAPEEQERRRVAVKDAMRFAWGNYAEHAFGGDEVDTTLGTNRSNVWGDIACTMVDGMDTLWIMGLKDEFAAAREYIANNLNFSHLGVKTSMISVFETTIREVGGLLSAHSLTGDDVFRAKAQDLVDRLMAAYDPKAGVFYALLNPHTKERSFQFWINGMANIAEMGTLQLELRYMTDITGNKSYAEAGDAFFRILLREGSYNGTGLFPTLYDHKLGKFVTTSKITFGSLADSFYEYLLKVFIYSGKRESDMFLRRLYDDAMEGLDKYVLKYANETELFYLQDIDLPNMQQGGVSQMEHLACFAGGMLALGTLHDEDELKNARHLHIAKQLGETCYQMYHRQPSGLSPESVTFPTLYSMDNIHRLRPEVIETLFYLFRVTKDERYRQQGWEIFQSLERNAKTAHGYSTVEDVTKMPTKTSGQMESFFLAETLKYHYLLQAPPDLIPLDEFVFNTEAHPLRIRRQPSTLY